MRHLLMTGSAAAAILASSLFAVQAMPVGIPALDGLTPIENVAVCFYIDGWRGPGMYQCGFRHREGRGWVGERRAERRDGHREDRREDRRGDRRDPRLDRGEFRLDRGEFRR